MQPITTLGGATNVSADSTYYGYFSLNPVPDCRVSSFDHSAAVCTVNPYFVWGLVS